MSEIASVDPVCPSCEGTAVKLPSGTLLCAGCREQTGRCLCDRREVEPVAPQLVAARQRFVLNDRRGQQAWLNVLSWIVAGGPAATGRGDKTGTDWTNLIIAEGAHRMDALGMSAAEALESLWDDIVSRRLK